MIHNQLHMIDLVLIGAYLIAMVMIGLVVVKKVKNMDDDYLGGLASVAADGLADADRRAHGQAHEHDREHVHDLGADGDGGSARARFAAHRNDRNDAEKWRKSHGSA